MANRDRVQKRVKELRDTDPIGGPVFEPDASGEPDPDDVRVEDPATNPTGDQVAEGPTEIESDRVAWSEVAGHSHYLREQVVKGWVEDLKDAMLLNTAANADTGPDQ